MNQECRRRPLSAVIAALCVCFIGLALLPGAVAADLYDDSDLEIDLPSETGAGAETEIAGEVTLQEAPVADYYGDVDATLFVDGDPVSTTQISIEDGETTAVEFSHGFSDAGSATVHIEAAGEITREGRLGHTETIEFETATRSVTIDIVDESLDEFDADLEIDAPEGIEAGERVEITGEISLPDAPRSDVSGQVEITLYEGDRAVTAQTVSIRDGETTALEFTHEFHDDGSVEVSLGASGELTREGEYSDGSVALDAATQPVSIDVIDGVDDVIDGEIDVAVPDSVAVGERAELTGEISLPDAPHATIYGTVAITVYVDGRPATTRTVSVSDGETATVAFTHEFQDDGVAEVRLEAAGELTRDGEYSDGSVAVDFEGETQPVAIEIIEDIDDLVDGTIDVEVPDRVIAGEEAVLSGDLVVPDVPAEWTGTIEVVLTVDGEAASTQQVSLEDGTAEIELRHEFQDEGEVELRLAATGEITRDGNRTVDVEATTKPVTVSIVAGLDAKSVAGAAFTVPESLEDDVDAARDGIPAVVDEYDLGSDVLDTNAFVVATDDELFVVFTAEEPRDGYASVEGRTTAQSVTRGGLSLNVLVADDVTFADSGRETSVKSLYESPTTYDLEFVTVDAHHQRTAHLTDHNATPSYSTTAGILLEEPRAPDALFDGIGENARELLHEPTSEDLEELIGGTTNPHVFTTSFQTSFWQSGDVTVDGIVLSPDSPAQAFVTAFDDDDGFAARDSAGPLLYVVDQQHHTDRYDDPSELTENPGSVDGDTVTVETNLFMSTISSREVIVSSTPTCPDGVQVSAGCVPVVHDLTLHGGVAWESIPESRDDLLMVVGASSWEQEKLIEPHRGTYEITGEVVSTDRIDDSLPDGAILIIYDLEKTGDIDWDAMDSEIRDRIEARSGDVADRLESQAAVDGDSLDESPDSNGSDESEDPADGESDRFTELPLSDQVRDTVGVERVSLDTTAEPDSVTFVAEIRDTLPAAIERPPGTVLEYYEFSVTDSSSDLNGAEIELSVDLEGVADDDELVVHRYADGEWQALETTEVERSESTARLKAETPGFSYFAVSTIESGEPETDTDGEPTEGSSADGETNTDGPDEESTTEADESGGNESEPDDTAGSTTDEESDDEIPGFTAVGALIAALLLGSWRTLEPRR